MSNHSSANLRKSLQSEWGDISRAEALKACDMAQQIVDGEGDPEVGGISMDAIYMAHDLAEYMEQGLSINTVRHHITELLVDNGRDREVDETTPLASYIDRLPILDEYKDVLRSIRWQKRSGYLNVVWGISYGDGENDEGLDVSQSTSVQFPIPKNVEEMDDETFCQRYLGFLKSNLTDYDAIIGMSFQEADIPAVRERTESDPFPSSKYGDIIDDALVRSELEAVGVGIIEGDEPVRDGRKRAISAIMGKLGELTLYRQHSYWRVFGPMPKAIVDDLYDDPIGKKYIRAFGGDGRHGWDYYPEDAKGKIKTMDHYDIDTPEALRIFVDKMSSYLFLNEN